MISIKDLKPSKAMSDSQQLDKDSILMLRDLFNHHHINDSQLQEGGTQDNTDGYIELLDEEDRPEGKVCVQVKHLTYHPENGKAFYDIPSSLIGYAGRFKGEVVIFIACDSDNKTFYWKCIDGPFIDSCLQKGKQGTYRYSFQENERADAENIDDTLAKWRKLYQAKIDSIKDEKESLLDFMSLQRKGFNQIPSSFYGVSDSFIKRDAIDVLYNWVTNELAPKESVVKLLIGEAGVGKSVVIKSLIEKLEADGIRTLSIKADRSNISEDSFGPLNLQTLQSAIDLISTQQDKVVLIIDQIDALSQSLSNDRQKLNVLLDAVSSLKSDSPSTTRIIVSCRRYDLIYDSSLKSLGVDNALELGALSENEVQSVVEKLSPGLFGKLNNKTRKLLKTAQLLDMFCRLYAGGHRQVKYDSEIALFDELWLHIVNNCPEQITSSAVEETLFKVAKTIQDSETLSPFWSPSSKDYPTIQYLASEGVIKLEGGQVSFFHQSFLDYTSAKQYIQSDRSFVRDIESGFQGLEIRSMIKLVLEYLRSHSERHYKDALLELLDSNQIRLHIKLIAVSAMASSKQVFTFERKKVKEFYDNNHQLYAAFLNGATTEWFPSQYSLLRNLAKTLIKDSDFFSPITFFLSRNAMSHSEDVVSFVEDVEDEETRNNLAYFLLRGEIDYRVEGVKRLYRSLIGGNPSNAVDCIRKAINTDMDFAIEETKRLLYDYLCSDEKRRRNHDDYVLVEIICKNLFEAHPRQFFKMMVECFLDVIEKTSMKTLHWYSTDSVFGVYSVNDYIEKLYNWLEESGEKEATFAATFVPRLLETASERPIRLAFAIMTCSPSSYSVLLTEIVSDDKKLDDYLEDSDFQYYFLELLKAWYPLLSIDEKEWYQKRILSFKSYTDSLFDKKRKYGMPPYFSLWRRKWKLLYTVPQDGILDDLRRCKLELRRRYGGDFENEKRSSGVTMAMACGGITTSEVYKTFSDKAWLRSFYGVKVHRPQSNNGWIPFDERVHASEFSTCVSENPSRYFTLVKRMFIDERVSDMYRFSGLQGLVKGGYDPKELLPMFRHFLNNEFIIHDSYDFFQLAGYFSLVENVADELFRLYHNIITSCEMDIPSEENVDSMEQHVTNMLNHAINTTSGHALKALLDLSAEPVFRERVYKELEDICEYINPGLRLLALHKIYSSGYFEGPLFESLLDCYLPKMGIELLFFRPDLIQRYLYFNTEIVSDYIERAHNDPQAHIILAQIYYFGICHSAVSDYCRMHLEEILAMGEEKAVAKMVEVSYKYITDDRLSDLSKSILIKFANDERESVRKAYLLHCDDLPASSFPFFLKISQGWRPGMMHEWHAELEYVLRCCGKFPVECYNYINKHGFIGYREIWRLEDVLVKVLLAIYKKLEYDDDREMLEKLMDMFDELILRGNGTVMTALETMS